MMFILIAIDPVPQEIMIAEPFADGDALILTIVVILILLVMRNVRVVCRVLWILAQDYPIILKAPKSGGSG